MIAGILKEIKTEENRVSMTPAGVEVMRDHGHTVLVEKGAGAGADSRQGYAAGANRQNRKSRRSGLVMHVKEPMPSGMKWS